MIRFFVRLTLAYLVERIVGKPDSLPYAIRRVPTLGKINVGDPVVIWEGVARAKSPTRTNLPVGVALEDAGLFEPVKVRIR